MDQMAPSAEELKRHLGSCPKSSKLDNVVRFSDRARSNDKKLHILVAEGNPITQKVLRGLLEQAGHEVTMTGNGEEALDVLEQMADSISLAIVDMHMPRTSGPDTVKAWRFIECGIKGTNMSRLPIAILAAGSHVEAEQMCREVGAAGFLTKPVDSRLLLDKVEEWGRSEDDPVTANAAKTKAEVLDGSFLDEISPFGGVAFISQLFNDFKAESAKAIQETRKAMMARDYAIWQDKLQMLKGGASDVGAFAMAEACDRAGRIKPYEIEEQLAVGLLATVERARTETLSALQEYLVRSCGPARATSSSQEPAKTIAPPSGVS